MSLRLSPLPHNPIPYVLSCSRLAHRALHTKRMQTFSFQILASFQNTPRYFQMFSSTFFGPDHHGLVFLFTFRGITDPLLALFGANRKPATLGGCQNKRVCSEMQSRSGGTGKAACVIMMYAVIWFWAFLSSFKIRPQYQDLRQTQAKGT